MTTHSHDPPEKEQFTRKPAPVGFKALSQFDEFIQNSLEKFKFVDAKKEYYDITGDDANFIISHKSTIPDLVIWNKTFNKNECFEGANTAKDNPFPRFQFYLRVKAMKQQETKEKKKKEKDKKKSSTGREQDDILNALNSTHNNKPKDKDKEKPKEKEKDKGKDKDKEPKAKEKEKPKEATPKAQSIEKPKEIEVPIEKADFEPDYNTLPKNIMKTDNIKNELNEINKQFTPTSQKETNEINELNKNLKMFHFEEFENKNKNSPTTEPPQAFTQSEPLKFKENVFSQDNEIMEDEDNDQFNADYIDNNEESNQMTMKKAQASNRNEGYQMSNQLNVNRDIELSNEQFFNSQIRPQPQQQPLMQKRPPMQSQLQPQPQPEMKVQPPKPNFNLELDDNEEQEQNDEDPFDNVQSHNYSKTPFFQRNKGISMNQPSNDELNYDNPKFKEFDFSPHDPNLMMRMQMQQERDNQFQPPSHNSSQKSLGSKKKKEKKPKKPNSSQQFPQQEDFQPNDYFDNPMPQFSMNNPDPYQQQGMPFPMTLQMNRGFHPHQPPFPGSPMTPQYNPQQNFFQPPPLNDLLLSLVDQYFDDKGWFITDREGKILASFTSFELFQFLNQRRDFGIGALIITALNSPLIFNGEQIWMILSQTLPVILQSKLNQMASLEEMNQFQKKQKKKKKALFEQEQQQNNYNIHLQYIANELTFNNYPVMNNLQGGSQGKMGMPLGKNSSLGNQMNKPFNMSEGNMQNMMYQQQQHQLQQQKLQQMYLMQQMGQGQGQEGENQSQTKKKKAKVVKESPK